jgi:uncharacterized protein (TIGR02145 family)/uncharacterized repeat protein (TIGR02543 family)
MSNIKSITMKLKNLQVIMSSAMLFLGFMLLGFNLNAQSCDSIISVNHTQVNQDELTTLLQDDGITTNLQGNHFYKVVINAGGGYSTHTDMMMCLDNVVPVSGVVMGESDASEIHRTQIGTDPTLENLFKFNNLGWVDVAEHTADSELFLILDSKWGTNIDTWIYYWFGTNDKIEELGYSLLDDYTDDFGSISIEGYYFENTSGCEPTVTYQGQTYNTIEVGDQCWLKENLNVGTMILSEENQSDNGVIEKYCYGDLPANCETYGGLYQWREAMQYIATPGTQGICPPGWRIATDDEWKMLEGAADSQFEYGDPEWDNMNFRGSDAGKNLKAEEGWMHNDNGLDILGAAILPGGHRDLCGAYYSEGHSNYLWTATLQGENTAWYRILSSANSQISRRYAHRNMAASVRCLKDATTTPTTYSLSLQVSPEGTGNATGAGEYEAGEPVSLTAEANTGWEFVSWTDDDGTVSEAANFTYTMPAEDVTLTANFIEEQTGFTCGDILTDPRDGQEYETVQIGDQCWMAENLNIGEAIPASPGGATNDSIIEKTHKSGDPETYFNQYGGLYSWNEMMYYQGGNNNNPSGVQGICPTGWHVPSLSEWQELITFIGNDNSGGKLKETGFTHWLAPNTGATNEYNYTALPGGVISYHSLMVGTQIGHTAAFWTATSTTSQAYSFFLVNDNADIIYHPMDKPNWSSVRCIKDSVISSEVYSLSLQASPEGAGITTGAGDYEVGEDVSITVEANPGWEFVNWTDDDGIVSETANFTYTMPAEDVTLTANFTEEQTGFTCGDNLTDPRDGQEYETVQIGDQCWMAENLAYLPEVSPSSQGNGSDPYYYVYDYQGTSVAEAKATTNYQTYGVLYNWPASLDACPEGWHLPTDDEWKILEGTVDSQYPVGDPEWDGNGIRGFDAGKNLKSTFGWNNNGNGTDLYGFVALPGGNLWKKYDSFGGLGNTGYWWSSSESTDLYAWNRALLYGYEGSRRLNNSTYASGFSVRCLMDTTTAPTNYSLILQVSPDDAGSVTGAGQYEAGEPVNLTAEANTGWEFVNWTDDEGIVSEVPNFTYTMPAEDVTLTANFTEEQTGFTCGDNLTDPRDGQQYETVQIGDQCWMAENLAYLPEVSPSSQGNGSDPYYYVYDYQGTSVAEAKATTNYQTYGVLYNWPASLDACPEGWHLPTDNEWKILEGTVDSQYPVGDPEWDGTGFRGLDAGENLKSTSGWNSNGNGTDLYGFGALPGGIRHFSGSYYTLGFDGYWWSSSETSGTHAWSRGLGFVNDGSGRDNGYKTNGFSVRCLKDN